MAGWLVGWLVGWWSFGRNDGALGECCLFFGYNAFRLINTVSVYLGGMFPCTYMLRMHVCLRRCIDLWTCASLQICV
ncbi:hypothetical protein LSH36_310g00036 [Paralvinella palmiformis]|uniref:Uncharacterized protein n=1 Tax=Paralvinella palmiformis TaxID=53620 RepID=A0AAD9N2G8_9ANNE|nr:hypothetical protein LSH36_310g00036 [Paralvinella palmiformis]